MFLNNLQALIYDLTYQKGLRPLDTHDQIGLTLLIYDLTYQKGLRHEKTVTGKSSLDKTYL